MVMVFHDIMANNNQQMTASERIVAEARKHQTDREKTYRGQALKMYPWVCGRCSREFTNANLQELTVHGKGAMRTTGVILSFLFSTAKAHFFVFGMFVIVAVKTE
jgi:hypothetical protein